LTSTSFCQFLLNGKVSGQHNKIPLTSVANTVSFVETEKLPGKLQAKNDFQLMQ